MQPHQRQTIAECLLFVVAMLLLCCVWVSSVISGLLKFVGSLLNSTLLLNEIHAEHVLEKKGTMPLNDDGIGTFEPCHQLLHVVWITILPRKAHSAEASILG